MKILEIDYDYYSYPQGISSIEEFISYINRNYNSFISMTQFEVENCAFPYLIEEEKKQKYLNVSQMKCVTEVDATVLPKIEYDARLEQVVRTKCVDCTYYTEVVNGDNLKGHRGKITLDGDCWGFVKKED